MYRNKRVRRISAIVLIMLLLMISANLVYANRDGESKEPSTVPTALVVEDLTSPLTADDLANALVGQGVTISNVTYTGADVAAGAFSGGAGIIGFEEGIVLGSGSVVDVVGPNVSDSVTTDNGQPGDTDLSTLAGFPTYDAVVLEFDFVPTAGQIFFRFVFSSDEYNEYVNSEYNDVFAFYVNGTNCATVGAQDDPITINTINNGNPYDTDPRSHPELYINNDLDDGGGTIDTEMDGLTVVLTCGAAVNSDVTNHMRLAIADGSDSSLDSNVFIEAGSLTTEPTSVSLSQFEAGSSNVGLIVLGLFAVLASFIGLMARRRSWR